jgi:hypothetical protein
MLSWIRASPPFAVEALQLLDGRRVINFTVANSWPNLVAVTFLDHENPVEIAADLIDTAERAFDTAHSRWTQHPNSLRTRGRSSQHLAWMVRRETSKARQIVETSAGM